MTTIQELIDYITGTGLDQRIENLKPGDSFGVELPIDEANGKWLRFWLSAEGENEVEYVNVDFEGVVSFRACCDTKKLEDWAEHSGILEFAKLAEEEATTEKAE